MPDAARAYRVLDYIEAHPERHDQADFINLGAIPYALADKNTFLGEAVIADSCGTTACYAGWTVLLDGQRVNRHGRVLDDVPGVALRSADIEWRAIQLLDINTRQADDLFYAAQNLDELRDAVADIFGPRPADA